MLYVVYFGSGDNWALIETHASIDFQRTLAAFHKRQKHPRLVSDFIDFINRSYGEGMARRATYQQGLAPL